MNHQTPSKILRIDSSVRGDASVTRGLADELVEQLLRQTPDADVIRRDLADGLPLIDADWVTASFTEAEQRTPAQVERLSLSETLLNELEASDRLIITVPVYNFSIPAALKAWVDLVMRARRSFRYTENGPVGLLKDRPTYLLMASGGTPVGSEMDFCTGYLRHVLGFIGIKDVHLVAADRMNVNADASLARARREIAALAGDWQSAAA